MKCQFTEKQLLSFLLSSSEIFQTVIYRYDVIPLAELKGCNKALEKKKTTDELNAVILGALEL
jgi:hypothetical protein